MYPCSVQLIHCCGKWWGILEYLWSRMYPCSVHEASQGTAMGSNMDHLSVHDQECIPFWVYSWSRMYAVLSVFTMQSDQLNKNNGLYLSYQTLNFATTLLSSWSQPLLARYLWSRLSFSEASRFNVMCSWNTWVFMHPCGVHEASQCTAMDGSCLEYLSIHDQDSKYPCSIKQGTWVAVCNTWVFMISSKTAFLSCDIVLGPTL